MFWSVWMHHVLMIILCDILYPCLPWYDASDEWLFACSGDATQSEVFPISHLENTRKNQLARSKKFLTSYPVKKGTRMNNDWSSNNVGFFLKWEKKTGIYCNRIKALGLCQGCTRPAGRAPGRPSPRAWSSARGSGTTLPQTLGFNP